MVLIVFSQSPTSSVTPKFILGESSELCFSPLFLCDVCPNMHPTYLLIDQTPGCCLLLPRLLLGLPHLHLASLPALEFFPIPSHSYSQKLPSPAQVRDSSLSTKSGEQARKQEMTFEVRKQYCCGEGSLIHGRPSEQYKTG